MYTVMDMIHRAGWLILVILFLVAYINLAKGNQKPYFILHQIARLFYIVMIVTGVYMLFGLGFPVAYIIKAVLALWLIYIMEAMLGRTKRGVMTDSMKKYYWLQFVIALIVVVLIGFGVIL
ncbi:uncharacterized protein DUF1516 [Salsuginibacillus halophilus]|uniref:Uncharacterized protein DUF1516 n=1 Tax=Salsuginibacillus halophilus TaxID=517424 RepID=A0A2P8HCJ5_9BACI|nr:DUF1516 family protein [Salsuginibacillus halophilus]PSL43954.1 uncharacterized protein DUF1516 [Salsuginibacillus halophilus]